MEGRSEEGAETAQHLLRRGMERLAEFTILSLSVFALGFLFDFAVCISKFLQGGTEFGRNNRLAA